MKKCDAIPCAGNEWGFVEKCTELLSFKWGRTSPIWCKKQWRQSFVGDGWGPVCKGGAQ